MQESKEIETLRTCFHFFKALFARCRRANGLLSRTPPWRPCQRSMSRIIFWPDGRGHVLQWGGPATAQVDDIFCLHSPPAQAPFPLSAFHLGSLLVLFDILYPRFVWFGLRDLELFVWLNFFQSPTRRSTEPSLLCTAQCATTLQVCFTFSGRVWPVFMSWLSSCVRDFIFWCFPLRWSVKPRLPRPMPFTSSL